MQATPMLKDWKAVNETMALPSWVRSLLIPVGRPKQQKGLIRHRSSSIGIKKLPFVQLARRTIPGCPMEIAAEESLGASACNSQLMIALPVLSVHSVPERKVPHENSCCCHE